MENLKTLSINRLVTLEEQQAYVNLQSYDNGEYEVKSLEEIEKILNNPFKEKKYTPKALEITQQEVDMYVHFGQVLNEKHSNFKPGVFSEKNAYEASFSKKSYYDSEFEFIVELFISHHNIHAFCDGNKRTALNFFIDLLHKFTGLVANDIITLQDSQILFLEKHITKQQFKQIIYNKVEKKMFKTNLKCNLEHLIPRGDIDIATNTPILSQSDRRSSFNLTDLESGQFFYQQLKKPFFQRDTNQWTVERLEKLITTFLDDGLIPAIILWENSEGDIYIIDGAHRISSLIAWVNSDYGRANELNDSNHPEIENYINNKVGSYSEIKSSDDPKYKSAKQIIGKRSISIQWVIGDYTKVKEAFIRINEQGVVISADEKELIENDDLPISQLSRAILSHGQGQKAIYQNENTKELFKRFFTPFLSHQLKNYPLCGSLNEDFVISKIYNAVKIIDNSKKLDRNLLELKSLQVLQFIQDDLSISHKIYFYGATQKFKTNSFYGFIRFALLLIENKELSELFIKYRKSFEEFLVNNERHIQEIARKKRQAKRAYEVVCTYYRMVLEACESNDFSGLKSKYNYLNFDENKNKMQTPREKTIQKNYDQFIAETPRCMTCEGFIDGQKDEQKNHKCCLG